MGVCWICDGSIHCYIICTGWWCREETLHYDCRIVCGFGGLLSLVGLSEKSPTSISLSVSGSNCPLLQVCHQGRENWTLAKEIVGLCELPILCPFLYNFSALSKKLLSLIFRIGMGVCSNGGIFSLSELVFLGSLKSLSLNSNPGVRSHCPESEVMLGDIESNLHLGLVCSLSVCLSQGLYFSILFSQSSFRVCLQHFVFTFRTNSTESTGRSQVKKPFLESAHKFRVLAIFLKF